MTSAETSDAPRASRCATSASMCSGCADRPQNSSNASAAGPYIIGITGGSSSGKTSVSQSIIRQLGLSCVVLISMDSFYRPSTPEQIAAAIRSEHNFDHPDCMDYDLIYETFIKIKQSVQVEIPIYDFSTHSRLARTNTIPEATVVIFEGIHALYDSRLRDLMDLKIFVDTDDDLRLARRLLRDIAERGRDKHGVLDQYRRFVKPSFDEFIYPTVKYADVIIPRGLDNTAAINFISQHISRQLQERGVEIPNKDSMNNESR